MKILIAIAWAAIVLGAILFAGSFPIEASYSAKSKWVQRVEKNEGAELFGEEGTPIGTPQRLVVDDPKAFTGRRTAEGAEVVDEGYLKSKGIYPLQMQTVSYLTGIARIGGAAALFFGTGVWYIVKRKANSSAAIAQMSPP